MQKVDEGHIVRRVIRALKVSGLEMAVAVYNEFQEPRKEGVPFNIDEFYDFLGEHSEHLR